MTRKALTMAFFLFLAFSFLAPSGGAVSVSVDPAVGSIKVGESSTVKLLITNDGSDVEGYTVTVFGPHLEWISLGDYFMKLQPGEMRETGIVVYPINSEGETISYDIQVYTPGTMKESDTARVYLTIEPRNPVEIKSLRPMVSGNSLDLSMDMVSVGEKKGLFSVDIIDARGELVKSVPGEFAVNRKGTVEKSVPIGGLAAGDYDVVVTLADYGYKARSSFSIEPVEKVTTERKIVSTPFYREVEITVNNEGNTVRNYVVSEGLKKSDYVNADKAPDQVSVQGNDVTYNWELTGMMTGTPYSVKYRIDYWINEVAWVVVAAGLLGVFAVSMAKSSNPKITKHNFRKSDGHLIVLEVKGARNVLKNVMVRDRVSPLARVTPEEFQGPRPAVKEFEGGTELTWHLGDIKPKGSFFLSYKVRPLVGASLRMPRAYLTFRGESGELKGTTYSKQVILE